MFATERARLRANGDTRMDRPHAWRGPRWPTPPPPAESELWAMAERKARYGHRDWLVWRDRLGQLHAAVKTAASLKQALLDTGTQYRFTCIGATDGWRHIVSWPIGLNMLRQTKYGI